MELDAYYNVALIVFTTIFLCSILRLIRMKVSVDWLLYGTGRRLSVYEDAFNMSHQERNGSGIICLVLALKSKKKLLKEHVEDALLLLAKRQRMLRAVIFKYKTSSTLHEQGTYFVIKSDDKVSAMLDISDSPLSDWKEVWCELTSKSFSELLWRVVLLKDEYVAESKCYMNTFVFSLNHACVDEVSSIIFAKQFLENLNSTIVQRSDTYKFALKSDVTKLLKNGRRSMLKFLSDWSGLSFLSKLLFKRKLRSILATKQSNPFFIEFPPNPSLSSSPATKLLHKVYTKAETTKIINACKRNNCTVTGALMAIAHTALCQMLKSGLDNGDIKLEHSFAINAKRCCRSTPREDYLGHFSLTCHMTLGYVDNDNEQEFWQLAQESTKHIHRSLKDEEYIDQHIAICESFNSKELLNEILCPHEQAELNRSSFCNGISSAGSFNFNEGLNDPVHELDYCMFWNLVHRAPGVLYYYNVTVNGKMSWVIAYDCSRVSDHQAEQVSNWCFENLLSFSQVS